MTSSSFDFDELYKRFCDWKTYSEKKEDEIVVLKRNLNYIKEGNVQGEQYCQTLEKEASNCNEAVLQLQKTVTKLKNFEVENVMLTKEIKEKQEELEDTKLVHHVQLVELQTEVTELKKLQSDLENEVTKLKGIKAKNEEHSLLLENLQRKDQTIYELEQKCIKLANHKKEEISKLKIEHEKTIQQIRAQSSVNKKQVFPLDVRNKASKRSSDTDMEIRPKEVKHLKTDTDPLDSRSMDPNRPNAVTSFDKVGFQGQQMSKNRIFPCPMLKLPQAIVTPSPKSVPTSSKGPTKRTTSKKAKELKRNSKNTKEAESNEEAKPALSWELMKNKKLFNQNLKC